jgi:hypothetical protein
MKLKTKLYTGWAWSAMLAVALLISCQPDEFEGGNGLTGPDVAASFTVTPVTGMTNVYVLQANTENVLGIKWDKGFGTGAALGKSIDTVFYPDAGTYNVTLTTIGVGGKLASVTQDVVVATSDPVAGNLVVDGKMEVGDPNVWKKLAIGGNSVTFDIAEGKLKASGGGWGHAGIYQAIEVIGGKKYKLDLNVSGSGATDTWFEVYLGKAEPVQGSDYSDGGIRLGLNTWAGCGKTEFNGKLSQLSCAGSGSVVEFAESGTVYLLIKSGGANLGDTGITIDNVELRGTN